MAVLFAELVLEAAVVVALVAELVVADRGVLAVVSVTPIPGLVGFAEQASAKLLR